MTQAVKVTVTSSSDAGGSTECVVPVIRLLYSFHSSGLEIKQLLGPNSDPLHLHAILQRNHVSLFCRRCAAAQLCLPSRAAVQFGHA
jgi:hypothetical protein